MSHASRLGRLQILRPRPHLSQRQRLSADTAEVGSPQRHSWEVTPTRKRIVKFTALALLALALHGCIIVKDISSAWHAAVPDTALVGDWASSTRNSIHAPKGNLRITRDEQHHALVVRRYVNEQGKWKVKSNDDARTLTLGKATFAIIRSADRKADNTSASVVRYRVNHKTLAAYSLKPAVVKKAIVAGDLDGELVNGKIPQFPDLNKNNRAWLAETAADRTAWRTDAVYHKVKTFKTPPDIN